ncbi:thioredoxin domain-containing protein [Cytobacillus sp. IB215665]|uniref:thioredoxin domain-containing protein n=1 Tax=Cytobacillus sp. IB215665 TaxID=3097357 RepID=UPI002A0F47E7|nr:thioredoxin domain-containing protein [Cytobacillus sp. IB215665]MDX8367224.1 thioredoxin domain-containing protein [Cytobacillus sp. IB215665]
MTSHPPIETQPTVGKADAPVSIVEFGDFKCPACKSWGENIYPKLKKDYIDKGVVKLSYINVQFHGEESTLGSLAAESVYRHDSNSYWDFHKKLYGEQPGENHDGQWITTEKLLKVAMETTDIDLQQLENDINEESTIEEVNLAESLVNAYQIQMTPTIIINSVLIENPFDYEKIVTIIEEEIEGN